MFAKSPLSPAGLHRFARSGDRKFSVFFETKRERTICGRSLRVISAALTGIVAGSIGLTACTAPPAAQSGYVPSSSGTSHRVGAHLRISSEHPPMADPVDIVGQKGHLYGRTAAGKSVIIRPMYTLPITKEKLESKPRRSFPRRRI